MKRAEKIYWINENGNILAEEGKTHTEYIWDKFGKVDGDAREYAVKKGWIRVRLEKNLCAIHAERITKQVLKKVLKTLPHNDYLFDLEINGNYYKNIPLEVLNEGMLSIYPYKFY